MLALVLKLGTPALAAALLALHQLTAVFAAPALGLTNVMGAPQDCAAPTQNAVCAPLFPNDGDVIWPGKAPKQATVQLTWHGSQATRAFGLYLSRYQSKAPASQAGYCQAADPAEKLNLTIKEGDAVVYQGTVSDFAAHHAAPQDLLRLPDLAPGAAHTFTFAVGLDRSADNAYMGCVSTADLAWYAQ